MIKFLLVFVVLALCFNFGITMWRSMSGKDRWSLTKSVMYSIIVALLAVLVMVGIVILF